MGRINWGDKNTNTPKRGGRINWGTSQTIQQPVEQKVQTGDISVKSNTPQSFNVLNYKTLSQKVPSMVDASKLVSKAKPTEIKPKEFKPSPKWLSDVANTLDKGTFGKIEKAGSDILGSLSETIGIKQAIQGTERPEKAAAMLPIRFGRGAAQMVMQWVGSWVAQSPELIGKSPKPIPITDPILQKILGTNEIVPTKEQWKRNTDSYGPVLGTVVSGINEVGNALTVAGGAELGNSFFKNIKNFNKPARPSTTEQTSQFDVKPNLESYKTNAAMQVEYDLSKKIGPESGKMYSRFIKEIDTSNIKNIAELEKAMLKQVPYEPAQTSIKAWAKSVEQGRFNVIENQIPNTTASLKTETPPQITELPKPGIKTLEESKFSPSSMENQFQGFAKEAIKQIESSNEYRAKLNELGGGRTITNVQTYKTALDTWKGVTDEFNKLKNIQQGKPVSEVDVAKGQLVMKYLTDELQRAQEAADPKQLQVITKQLSEVAPGFNNLRATGGRILQMNTVQVFQKGQAILDKIKQLTDSNANYNEWTRELSGNLKSLSKLQKVSGYGKEFIRTIENYSQAAKLTSIVSQAVNATSNVLTFLTARAPEKIIRAGIQLTKGNAYEAAQTVRFAFGRGQGFKNATSKFLKTLIEKNPDLPKAEIGKGTLTERLVRKIPENVQVVGRTLNPFRWLSAADNFFKAIIKDSELATKAYTKARGDAKLLTELQNNPPPAWVKEAMNTAKEYTYQMDPDIILGAAMKMRNIPGGRILIPFIQTPYNLVKFQLQRSPLGLLSPKNIGDIVGRGTDILSRRIALREEALSRILVGSGISLAAYYLAEHGEITGAYPQDPQERALWEAEGRQPYSIRIGNKWLKYNRFQPQGLYLTQAALIKELVDSGDWKKVDTLASRMVFQTANAIQDLPFVSNMSTIFDAINDPTAEAEKVLRNTITGFIPNVLRDIRIQRDETQRQVSSLPDAIKNMIPGLSKSLPPKVDVLGQIKKYPQNRLERFSKVLTTSEENDATRILRNSKYSPVKPDTKLSVSIGPIKKEIQLTPEESSQFFQDMGNATKRAILATKNINGFEKMNIDIQQYLLKQLIDGARNEVRNAWKLKKLIK